MNLFSYNLIEVIKLRWKKRKREGGRTLRMGEEAEVGSKINRICHLCAFQKVYFPELMGFTLCWKAQINGPTPVCISSIFSVLQSSNPSLFSSHVIPPPFACITFFIPHLTPFLCNGDDQLRSSVIKDWRRWWLSNFILIPFTTRLIHGNYLSFPFKYNK